MGTTGTRLSTPETTAVLESLGDDGRRAAALGAEIDRRLVTVASLSELSAPLALDYIDRLRHPLPAMSPVTGVRITTSGYLAQAAVEADPAAYGALDVPVLGTLPAIGRRPPQDLSSRVVKATRRNFAAIRAVSDGVWQGLVAIITAAVHDQVALEVEVGGAQADPGPVWLEPSIIDSLLRFGWVLRQVDLHYHLEPEPR